MMGRLDQRGVAALEFCLIGVVFCALIFAVFDFGRYAITMQSLRALANAGAREFMINCYATAAIAKTTPSCSGDPLSLDQKKAVAPFLYFGGLAPTLNAPAVGASPATVTASQPGFTMLFATFVPWTAKFNAPSTSTKIPF